MATKVTVDEVNNLITSFHAEQSSKGFPDSDRSAPLARCHRQQGRSPGTGRTSRPGRAEDAVRRH